MKRLYKCVHWHQPGPRSCGGWVAQGRINGKPVTLGKRETQEECAKLVAKRLRCTVRHLRLPSPTPAFKRHSSKYHGVTHRSAGSRNSEGWVAQWAGKTLGKFDSEAEAAKAVAKVARKQIKNLRKVSKVAPRDLRARFSHWGPLYFGKNNTTLPGDLASQIALAKTASVRKIWNEEPMIELVSIMLKYGPWKEALHQSWGESQKKSGVWCPEERAHRLQSVLIKVVKNMSHKSADDEWASNIGNNVSHHSGPLAFLQRCKIITKCYNGRGEHVVLGKCEQKYRISSSSDKKVLKVLAQYVQVADILAQAGVPRCLADWEAEVTNLASKIKECGAPGTSGDYGLPWLLRSKLLVNMRVPLASSIGACLQCQTFSGKEGGRGLVRGRLCRRKIPICLAPLPPTFPPLPLSLSLSLS